VVEGMPEGGKIHQLTGVPSAFAPDYAPEEMFEIATKLYKASRKTSAGKSSGCFPFLCTKLLGYGMAVAQAQQSVSELTRR
jgi:hypothetical protein